jgi:hypothetical protein
MSQIHTKYTKIPYSGPFASGKYGKSAITLTRLCFKAAVSLWQQKLFLLFHLFHLLDLPPLSSPLTPISHLLSFLQISHRPPPEHRHHEQRTPKEAVHHGRVRTSLSSLPSVLICPPRVAIDARRPRRPPSRMSSNGPQSTSRDALDCSGTFFNGVASSVGAQSHPIYLSASCSRIGKKLEADLILSQPSFRDRFPEYGNLLLLLLIAMAVAFNA